MWSAGQCGLMSLRNPMIYRGGRPKQTSAKVSNFLVLKDVRAALRGSRLASLVELPFNTHVTVNFPSGIAEDRVPIYIARTIKNLRQWLRRKRISGAETTYLWVRETRPAQSSHVHLLLHMPSSIKLTNKRMASLLHHEIGIAPSEISDAAGRDSGSPVLVLRATADEQSRAWVKYVLKGISAAHAAGFDLRPARQGAITGKRLGIAENIGATEWSNWSIDYKIGGRDFALRRWRERASMAKRIQIKLPLGPS